MFDIPIKAVSFAIAAFIGLLALLGITIDFGFLWQKSKNNCETSEGNEVKKWVEWSFFASLLATVIIFIILLVGMIV